MMRIEVEDDGVGIEADNLRKIFAYGFTTKPSGHGFGLPLGEWLNEHEQLRAITTQSLRGLAERNIVQTEFVERLQDAHKNEHPSYYGALVWVFTMLEQWLQQHAAATKY